MASSHQMCFKPVTLRPLLDKLSKRELVFKRIQDSHRLAQPLPITPIWVIILFTYFPKNSLLQSDLDIENSMANLFLSILQNFEN